MFRVEEQYKLSGKIMKIEAVGSSETSMTFQTIAVSILGR
jgi:hypothetical protein